MASGRRVTDDEIDLMTRKAVRDGGCEGEPGAVRAVIVEAVRLAETRMAASPPPADVHSVRVKNSDSCGKCGAHVAGCICPCPNCGLRVDTKPGAAESCDCSYEVLSEALRRAKQGTTNCGSQDDADWLTDLARSVADGADDEWIVGFVRQHFKAPARVTEQDRPCPAGGSCPDPSLCREVGPCDDPKARERILAYIAENQREGQPGGTSNG